jgi:hypothetical protein
MQAKNTGFLQAGGLSEWEDTGSNSKKIEKKVKLREILADKK